MQKMQASRGKPVMRLDELTRRGFAESRTRAGEFRVFVVHTSRELTKASLSAVSALTRNLSARVTLLAVQIVPFPLQLDQPDVSPQFVERELATLARKAYAPVDVQVVLARDLEIGLQRVLTPSSVVVVASRRGWWPNAEGKLARSLARAGHTVAALAV